MKVSHHSQTQRAVHLTVTPPPYCEDMALPVPLTLSPSKVGSFTDCALAFRFSAIDRLPEPPSVPATRGTLVHAALERLFCAPPADRTPELALQCLEHAGEAIRSDPEYLGLGLEADDERIFYMQAAELLLRYFQLEDPTAVHPIGLELLLEIEMSGVRLRGIIDRLELDEHGGLIVTDYKTGKPPSRMSERTRLSGLHIYALLCERMLGRRPAKVQLLYLGGTEPVSITCEPDERSVTALERRLSAVWSAIERACEREDFRPHPSRLCDWCSFKPFCPAHGGDPAAAVVEAPVREPVLASAG